MHRRQFLQGLALLTGSALAPAITRAAEAMAASGQSPQNPALSTSQRQMCRVIAEMIIPTTDTPGAIAAGVPDFIELMVSDWYTDTERGIFFDGLDALNDYCRQHHGSAFTACDEDGCNAALTSMEALAADYQSPASHPFDQRVDEHTPFFNKVKELTVLGYYMSEVGARQELIYNPMPMEFRDIPFDDVGRQWSQ